ncbi:hypothetical protein [Endozoicomonas acroporae]|uniref:hypothetical protein n=1 Tax=Endozoicomonas acroporae TaxID=1701104 RepID=UPI003D7BD686
MYINDTQLPDSDTYFIEASSDTKSKQVGYGPFAVDISSTRAPAYLSQAGGATTDSAQGDDTLRLKNVGTVSSDEAVSHFKADSARSANTGTVFSTAGKIPAEFINEINDLLKKELTSDKLSELKEDKDSLVLLLTPKETKDEKNRSYNQLLDLEDTKLQGVPIKDMKEHTLKSDTEPEIKTIFSYHNSLEDQRDYYMAFGILESGDRFHFLCSYDCSCLGNDCSKLLIAPDWNSLIDHLNDDWINDFVQNMSQSNSALLTDWLKIHPADSLNVTRDKLKIVLNPGLLDKFCQQVINK